MRGQASKIGAAFLTGKLSITIVLFILAGGCLPETPRSPTHQVTKERLNTVTPEKAQQRVFKARRQIPRKGIPDFCTYFDRDKSEACISCQPKNLILDRCFKPGRAFALDKSCRHNIGLLKCLIEGPEIIKIRFTNSKEEQYLKNTPLIYEIIHQIAAESLSDAQQDTKIFFSVLDFYNQHKAQILYDQDTLELASILRKAIENRGPHLIPEKIDKAELVFVNNVEDLQKKRRKGEIEAEDGLKLLYNSLKALDISNQVLNIVEKINLEGLQDQKQVH